MKDMKAHIAKLRDQAAECALFSGEAETKEKREFFARLHDRLTLIADEAERALNGTVSPSDTFLGRKAYGPFPKQQEE
jgi:hypothetical protein